jgi:hypothetical protein
MYNSMKYVDPSGHQTEGLWCMNHPDDPGCRVLERNYDPEAAVAYALNQTEEGYKENFKENAVDSDKPVIDRVSLCTIFVMDSVIEGGGWDSGLPAEQMTWFVQPNGTSPYNATGPMLDYMDSRDDVEVSSPIYGDTFNAADFMIGDIIVYDWGPFETDGYEHAAIVTSVDLSTNTVIVHEMTGSAGPDGRPAGETNETILRYRIIYINEFIWSRGVE